MIVVPLPASMEIVGVLKVLSSVPNTFGARDIQTLQLMAGLLGAMVNHAARMKEQSEALRQSEARCRTIVDTMREGIWMVDMQGCTTFINSRLAEMMGYGEAEMLGRSFYDFIFEEDRALMERRFAERRQGQADQFDVLLRRRDGSPLWTLASVNPLLGHNNEFCGALALLSDITARKQAEVERETDLREIEGLNTRLRRGMDETHHRVKNNLQIVAAMIDMQVMEHRAAGSVPISELQRLGTHVFTLAIVHDILTRHLKEAESEQRLSVKIVLHRLLPLLQQTAGNRRIQFAIRDMQLTGKQCMAVALAASELIGNALKHGQGTVEVHLQAQGQIGTLIVADSGPGFPEGFDARQVSSTGLQLVLGVVGTDLCGTIAFQNRDRGGAQTTVTFPLPAECGNVASLPYAAQSATSLL